ncbi:MAG: flavodoxin-dependent (E)-4-hydroxy-3-methylbut-2-enyl-diphosphate synthase [Patescibacteria group bacterium]|nr:flavodoxin-dependent (E)-4-hydroxy-3-methylbut-2-enyl-diphosphate synthase [Patescibacteria group bacterium]
MATRRIKIGSIYIGGKAPVAIQSMTNTPTSDIKKTTAQINSLRAAGCDIIRVAVPDKKSALALKQIKKRIRLPLVADIHFDYKLALLAIQNKADKIRINPGNISDKHKIIAIIKQAKKHKIPIRIGVNAGSLENQLLKKYHGPTPQALVESALNHVKFFEKQGFKNIVLSLKHSDVRATIQAYQLIVKKINYPLHLGVTEAGTFVDGTVKSAIAIGALLYQGIGHTIRVSLSENPEKEVLVAKKILSSLNLRKKEPEIISCPTCARASIDVIKFAKQIQAKTNDLQKPLKIAVMGCLVNGPGEAKMADIGFCGIKNQPDWVMLFKSGRLMRKIKKQQAVRELLKEIKTLAKTKK